MRISIKIQKIIAKEILILFSSITIIAGAWIFLYLSNSSARKKSISLSKEIRREQKSIKNMEELRDKELKLEFIEKSGIVKTEAKVESRKQKPSNHSYFEPIGSSNFSLRDELDKYELKEVYLNKKRFDSLNEQVKISTRSVTNIVKSKAEIDSRVKTDRQIRNEVYKYLLFILLLCFPIRYFFYLLLWSIRTVNKQSQD